ncbi:hypothetical protein AV530_002918 [Patagioenas fasciata monilis]|uniref:Uncharacterized protein n=1 Tax=Patagioenas fasciata monilis TaxID=372326 RepID=A0A1V4K9L7_PATFA|nr:hypothetical protein AV530_002918 [Patagioenas fasciata monilis]
MGMAPGSKPCWAKERDGSSRRATEKPCQLYRSATGGREAEQLRFARDWTELELKRRRSNAECVRPQRGVPCLRAEGSRAPAQFGAALAETNKERGSSINTLFLWRAAS